MIAQRFIVLLLAGYTTLLFGLRILGPSNLTDNDQERPAAYIVDAVRNGHWIVQYDWTGDVTSKPPAYSWLAAIASLPFSQPNLFSIYLPCALAMFGSAALLAKVSAGVSHPRVGLLAGLFLLANPLAAKLVALARTDPLFTFTVTLTAALTFRAWQSGRGWPLAWLAAAFATLTKGPLGLVLGFAGLVAWFWERRSGAPSPSSRRHILGFGLWLVVCLGWFLLAWASAGPPLIRKMLGAELVQHAVGMPGSTPGSGLVIAPAYFLSRFVPWSALTLAGIWLTLRTSASDPNLRRLQRFCLAWLVSGLVILGLASHQRGDLIAPLLPAGALLAAIPAHRWTAGWSDRKLIVIATSLAVLLGLGTQFEHTRKYRSVFAESRGMASLAAELRKSGHNLDPLRHVDAPYALQFHLGTMNRVITYKDAADHLRASQDHTVAVRDRTALNAALGADTPRIRVIAAWSEPPLLPVEILALEPASR